MDFAGPNALVDVLLEACPLAFGPHAVCEVALDANHLNLHVWIRAGEVIQGVLIRHEVAREPLLLPHVDFEPGTLVETLRHSEAPAQCLTTTACPAPRKRPEVSMRKISMVCEPTVRGKAY